MFKRSAAFLFVVATGCGSNSAQGPAPTPSDQLPDLKPAAAPANGFQIVLPIVHGIEASSVDAQSAVNVVFADPNTPLTRSGNLAIVDTSLRVKPGNASMNIHCKMQNDMKLWVLTPHMHQWGQHITIEHVKGDGPPNRL